MILSYSKRASKIRKQFKIIDLKSIINVSPLDQSNNELNLNSWKYGIRIKTSEKALDLYSNKKDFVEEYLKAFAFLKNKIKNEYLLNDSTKRLIFESNTRSKLHDQIIVVPPSQNSSQNNSNKQSKVNNQRSLILQESKKNLSINLIKDRDDEKIQEKEKPSENLKSYESTSKVHYLEVDYKKERDNFDSGDKSPNSFKVLDYSFTENDNHNHLGDQLTSHLNENNKKQSNKSLKKLSQDFEDNPHTLEDILKNRSKVIKNSFEYENNFNTICQPVSIHSNIELSHENFKTHEDDRYSKDEEFLNIGSDLNISIPIHDIDLDESRNETISDLPEQYKNFVSTVKKVSPYSVKSLDKRLRKHVSFKPEDQNEMDTTNKNVINNSAMKSERNSIGESKLSYLKRSSFINRQSEATLNKEEFLSDWEND